LPPSFLAPFNGITEYFVYAMFDFSGDQSLKLEV